MAGNWYQGGIAALEEGQYAWNNTNLYVSLVAGTAVQNNTTSWQTISDFTGGGNSFVAGATNTAIPVGRASSYNTGADEYRFTWPATIVDLGSPSSGLSYCGVLIHEGDVGTGSSRIWAYQRSAGTTQGAAVEWGVDTSTNTALTLKSIAVSGADTGRGFSELILDAYASSWGGGSDTYAYSLVRNTSAVFNRDWATYGICQSNGMTFCTGTDFNSANIPAMIGLNRSPPDFYSSAYPTYRYYPTKLITGGLSWPKENLTTGEVATGVLGYVKSAGGVNASPIFMYNEISPAITLSDQQDVVWNAFDGALQNMLQVNVMVD